MPEIWTINRILARNGRARKIQIYEPKPKQYPGFTSNNPNDIQQGDILGPRYIKGDGRFYLLIIWRRLGTPKFFQMDNELAFWGSNR